MSRGSPYDPPSYLLAPRRELTVYLVVFDASFGGRERLQTLFNVSPYHVANWTSQFDNAVLVASERTATELTEWIHRAFPNGLFMVARVDRHAINGWMDPRVWEFIHEPRPAPPPESYRAALGLGPPKGGKILSEIARDMRLQRLLRGLNPPPDDEEK